MGDLHWLDTKLTRAIDFWVNAMLEGYIIEFAIEKNQSFSYAKGIFKFGIKGRPLKEIPLWINILLV